MSGCLGFSFKVLSPHISNPINPKPKTSIPSWTLHDKPYTLNPKPLSPKLAGSVRFQGASGADCAGGDCEAAVSQAHCVMAYGIGFRV